MEVHAFDRCIARTSIWIYVYMLRRHVIGHPYLEVQPSGLLDPQRPHNVDAETQDTAIKRKPSFQPEVVTITRLICTWRPYIVLPLSSDVKCGNIGVLEGTPFKLGRKNCGMCAV